VAVAIARRVGVALLSLLALLAIVFTMVRLTGDPLELMLPEGASQQDFDAASHKLGLDQPIPVQFGKYLGQVVTGDLGRSVRGGVGFSTQDLNPSVVHLIALRLPATAVLATAALIIVLLVGIPLGVYSARWRGSVFDHFTRLLASLGQAAPNFWIGLLLILFFAVYTGILPAGGLTAGGLVLPAITLAIRPIANLVRLLRSSMLEALNSDYVTFLRMKGMSETKILWKHALRNAGLTTLTFVGILISSLFTGSLLVETVFDWPGVGRLMIEAIDYRDFPLAQGVILMLGTIYIVMNLVVDLLYTVLNPRLRAQ